MSTLRKFKLSNSEQIPMDVQLDFGKTTDLSVLQNQSGGTMMIIQLVLVAAVLAVGLATVSTPASAACRSGWQAGKEDNHSNEASRLKDVGGECNGSIHFYLGPGKNSPSVLEDTDQYHFYSDPFKNHLGWVSSAWSWVQLSYLNIDCYGYDAYHNGSWAAVECW